MAIIEVKVPQLSESVAEATLLQWKKQPGEAVAIDEILIEVETDKVVLEVPAPAAGVLLAHVVAGGATVLAEQVIGSGVFVWPVDNHSLSGNDYSYEHPGIDIAAGLGSPVYAADAGMVRSEGNDSSGYGNVIEIDHGNGYSTVYAHLSVIGVRACQSVFAGQQIGEAGNTGNSFGAHLHFAVIQDGAYINPWSVLPKP